jgi:hypothetical protein
MVKRNKGVEPRAPHGGHSARYEERREARGSVRQYAGAWTDAAACALLEGLHKDSQQSGGVTLTFLCKYASFSLQLPYRDVSWLYLDRILLYCHDTEKYG